MPLWGRGGRGGGVVLSRLDPQREYATCQGQSTAEDLPKVMKGELCSHEVMALGRGESRGLQSFWGHTKALPILPGLPKALF